MDPAFLYQPTSEGIHEGGRKAQKGPVGSGVVARPGRGDFFVEGGMADQLVRKGTATAIAPTTIRVIEKKEMTR